MLNLANHKVLYLQRCASAIYDAFNLLVTIKQDEIPTLTVLDRVWNDKSISSTLKLSSDEEVSMI